ncbi:MAG: hypothetical protein JWQ07_4182 [Ramlibacter sp.]|nr:hypothetical protein [Ramlibacter sp.]
MKALLATLLIAAAPALALAQSNAPAGPAAKPTIKKRGGAVVPKTVEEAIEVDDDPAIILTAADLEIAKLIHIGDIPCELGATVHVTRHKREGFFIVRAGLQRFRMHPVESRTGALRLEDPRAGAMWLQLGNKSMLMSQKIGRRLADECMSPAQAAVADALKKNPMPSLLEPLPATTAAPPAAAAPPAVAAPVPAVPASQ